MSENASITMATTLLAGNGAVLLSVYDVIRKQPQPLDHPWSLVAFLIAPPVIGLGCGFLMLGLIEIGKYNPRKKMCQWLNGLSLLGIGLPIGFWMMALVTGTTR